MFYLEWLSFYSSFTLLPKRACISRAQKDNFFWNRGLYVLELIPYAGENEHLIKKCFLRYIEIIPEYTHSTL